MRWDGTIGFPGGFIKGSEDPTHGLNRELAEEMNLKSRNAQVTNDDFLQAHFTAKFSFYLYTKEVSADEFVMMEKNAIYARDFGVEVRGAKEDRTFVPT